LSFVPPPDGGPVSMRHLSAWEAGGHIPLPPLTSLRFLALCIGLAIAIPPSLFRWRYSSGGVEHPYRTSEYQRRPHLCLPNPCFAWWHQTLPGNVLLRFPRAGRPGRLIENGRHTKNVQQPDQPHHRGLHLWSLRLTLPLPDGATGRGSSAHKPRLRPDLPRGTSASSR
jgi:hypothetical protein